MSEQQNTEYKQSWHDDYLRWVCGFANAQGGKISFHFPRFSTTKEFDAIDVVFIRKQTACTNKDNYSNG